MRPRLYYRARGDGLVIDRVGNLNRQSFFFKYRLGHGIGVLLDIGHDSGGAVVGPHIEEYHGEPHKHNGRDGDKYEIA